MNTIPLFISKALKNINRFAFKPVNDSSRRAFFCLIPLFSIMETQGAGWKASLEQGNRFTIEQVSQLKLGMKRREVVACMGSSLVALPARLSPNKLHYVHFFAHGEAVWDFKRVSLTFDDKDRVIQIDLSEELKATLLQAISASEINQEVSLGTTNSI